MLVWTSNLNNNKTCESAALPWSCLSSCQWAALKESQCCHAFAQEVMTSETGTELPQISLGQSTESGLSRSSDSQPSCGRHEGGGAIPHFYYVWLRCLLTGNRRDYLLNKITKPVMYVFHFPTSVAFLIFLFKDFSHDFPVVGTRFSSYRSI